MDSSDRSIIHIEATQYAPSVRWPMFIRGQHVCPYFANQIGDFGTARLAQHSNCTGSATYTTNTSRSIQMSFAWTAPEVRCLWYIRSSLQLGEENAAPPTPAAGPIQTEYPFRGGTVGAGTALKAFTAESGRALTIVTHRVH